MEVAHAAAADVERGLVELLVDVINARATASPGDVTNVVVALKLCRGELLSNVRILETQGPACAAAARLLKAEADTIATVVRVWQSAPGRSSPPPASSPATTDDNHSTEGQVH